VPTTLEEWLEHFRMYVDAGMDLRINLSTAPHKSLILVFGNNELRDSFDAFHPWPDDIITDRQENERVLTIRKKES
jgi:hypothetical protein